MNKVKLTSMGFLSLRNNNTKLQVEVIKIIIMLGVSNLHPKTFLIKLNSNTSNNIKICFPMKVYQDNLEMHNKLTCLINRMRTINNFNNSSTNNNSNNNNNYYNIIVRELIIQKLIRISSI